MSKALSVAAISALCVGEVSASLSCKDSVNKQQDWVFGYKQPNGFEYAYKDSSSTDETLKISPYSLNSSTNFAWATLHPLYEKSSSDLAYVAYNDEFPSGTQSSSGGHAKGVIASDGETGYWLIHSVPKYPDLTQSDFTWTASTIYGQTFLCVSLPHKTLDTLAGQIIEMHPHVYSSNMPSSLESSSPNMASLSDGSRISTTVHDKMVSFKSSGGQAFTSFAKDPKWDDDLYADLVQPNLKISMYVETWRRAPFLDSFCKKDGNYKYDTINVDAMTFPSNTFSYTQDHSKFGISTSEDSPYVCVGGINRMQSQRNRGGGTVCMKNKVLWAALNTVVDQVDVC